MKLGGINRREQDTTRADAQARVKTIKNDLTIEYMLTHDDAFEAIMNRIETDFNSTMYEFTGGLGMMETWEIIRTASREDLKTLIVIVLKRGHNLTNLLENDKTIRPELNRLEENLSLRIGVKSNRKNSLESIFLCVAPVMLVAWEKYYQDPPGFEIPASDWPMNMRWPGAHGLISASDGKAWRAYDAYIQKYIALRARSSTDPARVVLTKEKLAERRTKQLKSYMWACNLGAEEWKSEVWNGEKIKPRSKELADRHTIETFSALFGVATVNLSS